MLLELHIRNMALIEKADLDFNKGFTVISGETGAGKSILIDSINFALGAKISKDIISKGKDYAYVELIFKIEDEEKISYIKALDFNILDDGILIISRKLNSTRSILKVNDESVTLSKLSKLTKLLIDIHGQHEHQSLLSKSKQLELIDKMLDLDAKENKNKLSICYQKYKEIKDILSKDIDSYIREREIDILKYEIREIENANLRQDEEEKINLAYKKLKNISNIDENLKSVSALLEENSISSTISYISNISDLDLNIKNIENKLYDIDAELSTIKSKIDKYIEKLDYDENKFEKLQKRLDFINRFTSKYTSDVPTLLEMLKAKKLRLKYLVDFEANKEKSQKALEQLTKELDILSIELRKERKNTAKKLEDTIIKNLLDLNFLNVEFKIEFKELDEYTKLGLDDLEFMISTNPGNPLKPLKDVASGGELSRIMLAFKASLADFDEIDTLIFDEIDTGISGVTAQRVSEKIAYISNKHQVLAITHLPQIAAMSDYNYLIEKHSDGIKTTTDIKYIKGDDIILEIARLLGGSNISNIVLDTAKEMKTLANDFKKYRRLR